MKTKDIGVNMWAYFPEGKIRNNVIDYPEMQVLMVPAEIRNTLHNNGYAGRSFIGTVRGISFKPFHWME
jgi:hypothetical protein